MNYKQLDVYQRSFALVLATYDLSSKFPAHELYGLSSQIRRAAVSILLNIAEGCGRQNKKELRHFLKTSLGSNNEVSVAFDLGRALNYISEKEVCDMQEYSRIIGAQLNKWISSINNDLDGE